MLQKFRNPSILGIFHTDDNHQKISICPRHRDTFGIRWRCTTKKSCTLPPGWATHSRKEAKADRGITLAQSILLYNLTSSLVPVGSRKLYYYCSRLLVMLVTTIFFSLFKNIYPFSAICKKCRLQLSSSPSPDLNVDVLSPEDELMVDIDTTEVLERKADSFQAQSASGDEVQ